MPLEDTEVTETADSADSTDCTECGAPCPENEHYRCDTCTEPFCDSSECSVPDGDDMYCASCAVIEGVGE